MKKLLFVLFILCCAIAGYTQPSLLHKETDQKGSVIFAEFRTDSVSEPISKSKQLLQQLHALEQDEEFVLTESKTDELGFTHHYFNQYYKGIRVAYSSYSVHGRNNVINTVNGTYNKVGKVATVAELTEKEALDYATRFINAKVYKWEVPEEEQWLKVNYNESYYPKGELVVVKDRLKTNQQFRLAWQFNV